MKMLFYSIMYKKVRVYLEGIHYYQVQKKVAINKATKVTVTTPFQSDSDTIDNSSLIRVGNNVVSNLEIGINFELDGISESICSI